MANSAQRLSEKGTGLLQSCKRRWSPDASKSPVPFSDSLPKRGQDSSNHANGVGLQTHPRVLSPFRTASWLAAAREGLAFLAANLFVLVTNALALVRFRLAGAAYFRRKLADLLLVGAADDNRRRIGQFDGHALGRLHFNGVGIADGQHEHFLVDPRLVTDAFDLQLFFEPLRDAFDHVGEKTARQSVQCAVEALIVGPGYADDFFLFVVLNLDVAMTGQLELALGALDAHGAIHHLHFDPGAVADGLFANARHKALLFVVGWLVPPSFPAHLPDCTQQFAAHALGAGLPITHDAAARAQNGNPQPVEHRLQFGVVAIQSPASTAGSFQAADDVLDFGTVLKKEAQRGYYYLGCI